MRQRTYGKKSGRVISKAEKAFLNTSSPANPASPEQTRSVLTEKSQNARPVSRGKVDKDVCDSTGPSRSPEGKTIAVGKTRVKERTEKKDDTSSDGTTQNKQDASILKNLPGAPPSAAELVEAVKDLSISLPSSSQTTSSNSQAHRNRNRDHQTSNLRSIPPQPANIDAATLSHLQPLLACKNVSPVVEDFQRWADARLAHLSVTKIGEGSFGEVFRASPTDEDSSSSPSPSSSVILKLIPLAPARGAGSRTFTPVRAAATELRLLERMQRVPGFVEFRGACVVRGRAPARFAQLWRAYRDAGRSVASRDPAAAVARGGYAAGQVWLVVEMSDAGVALERVVKDREVGEEKRSWAARRVWDVFWLTVKAVAKAEVWAEFEHRDLHLGNICFKEACEDRKVSEAADGRHLGINRSGIEVTVIDYSLSRAAVGEEGEVLAYDFKKDRNLLKGEGDYQYDMYRYMAEIIGKRSADDFVPQTNVLWLHYILKSLLPLVETIDSKDKEIMGLLDELGTLLEPSEWNEWEFGCAGDLLDFGVEKSWFSPEDIVDS